MLLEPGSRRAAYSCEGKSCKARCVARREIDGLWQYLIGE